MILILLLFTFQHERTSLRSSRKLTSFFRNCGGSLSLFTPLVLAAGAILLIFLLQKDYLLLLTIRIRGESEMQTGMQARLRLMLASGATTALLMFLQSVISTAGRLTVSVWNINRSCSDLDYTLITIGRAISIVFIVTFIWITVLIFGGGLKGKPSFAQAFFGVAFNPFEILVVTC